MPQLFSNGARSELASPITATSTSITLKSMGDHFPACNYTGNSVLSQTSTENWIKLVIQDDAGFEIVYCYMHEASTNVFSNLKRGQENTTARVFATDSVVGLRPIGGDLQDLVNQSKANTEALATKADKTGDISGNAATATKLKNPVAIGGVLFDGASNIDLPGVNNAGNQNTTGNAGTATKLQTPRNITVGGTAKAFDGTAPITFTLGEVGAAAAVHSHADASSSVAGFMSPADKAKLNAVAAGATNDAPILITQGADLGSFTKPGLYYSHSVELTHSLVGKPTGLDNAFALDVRPVDPTVGTVAVYQSIYEYSSVKQWGRAVSSGGSTSWDRVYTEFSPPPVATTSTAGLMSAEDKVKLDAGLGSSLFEYQWHNGPRSSIPAGFIPCDGQQLTQLMYPTAYADVIAGKQHATTEEIWQSASLARNNWSTGGTGWVRVPDLNGVQVGSNTAFYLRGATEERGGTAVGDAIRNIVGELPVTQGNNGAQFFAESDGTGSLRVRRGSGSQLAQNVASNLSKYVIGTYFDASLSVPTAAENRPKSAYGVWIVRVFTGVSNAGAVDAGALVTQLAAIDSRVTSLEQSAVFIYPNGGTEAAPASITINSRYVSPNPFPGSHVMCEVEILVGGKWGAAGWLYVASGGQGVLASEFDGNIIVQTGAVGISHSGSTIGQPNPAITGSISSAPVRVKVLQLRGIA